MGKQETYQLTVFEVMNFGIGSILAVVLLSYWYQVLGVVGLTSVNYGGVRVHHLWVGLSISSIGFMLLLSRNRARKAIGAFLLGFGLVVGGEDYVQHCFVNTTPDNCAPFI